MLEIKECVALLDTDRTLQRGIVLRNPYVDPMHFMQVDLLERWRASGRQNRELFEALQASVSGIARGLQTTAEQAARWRLYASKAQFDHNRLCSVAIEPSSAPADRWRARCTDTTRSTRRW